MNAALVKIDVAAATLGWSAAKLFDLVEGPGRSGDLIEKSFVWVFNLANNPAGERRDLRFWMPELTARSVSTSGRTKFDGYQIDWVIARVLPEKRVNFHAGEVDQLFQIRPRTRIDLHEELTGARSGERGARNFYSRVELAEFLKRRWLGALYSRKPLLPCAAPKALGDTNKQTTHTAPSATLP